MPKRPRSHQLEDECRARFRQELPPQWVFRDTAPDYGIDGEVEIFDKNGVTTGMCFKVQLKATDKPDNAKGLSISLDQETWDYYIALKVPVLIVRYHSLTNRFFVRWAHTYDPYYKKGKGKNITFKFSSNNQWSKNTADRLASEVEAIRNISSAEIKLPIKVPLLFEDSEFNGVTTDEIGTAIKKLVKNVEDVIEIPFRSQQEYHTFIKFNRNEILISLAGKKACVLHVSKRVSAKRIREQLPYDALLGVGVAFHIFGQSNLGARFVSQFAEKSGLIQDIQMTGILLSCLTRAHRITEALSLSERLFEEQGSTPAPHFMQLSYLIKGNVLSQNEKEDIKGFLERRIQFCGKNNRHSQLACAHYNLANFLGAGERKLLPAFRHYREAARHDPSYWKRGYFLRELGGLLFLKQRYQASAHFYGLALKRRDRKFECRALYADALMHAGRYKDAQDNFDAFNTSNPNGDPEWRLKAWVLPTIRSVAEKQKRQPIAAKKLLAEIENTPNDAIEKKLDEILSLDALCSFAWYTLGNQRLRQHAVEGEDNFERRDTTDVFTCFLISSLIEEDNLGLWLQIILLMAGNLSDDREGLFPDIVNLAYRFNGEEFLTGFLKGLVRAELEPNLGQFIRETLRKTQDKVLKIIESKKKAPARVPALEPSEELSIHAQIT